MRKRPNIVFFFTDDQRFDTIAALGNREIQTPNLDRLVAAGTSFTHAHFPCGTWSGVCMPSRAMLLTGRTLFHLDRGGLDIPAEHTLLGETLQKAGYQTFGTGKWHNGTTAYARCFTAGGEIMFGGMGDHWNVPAYDFDPTGTYAPQPMVRNPALSRDVSYRHANHMTCGKHSSELFADAAKAFIAGRDRTSPYFLYLSFMAPHDPRTMPEDFRKLYDPEKLTLPSNYMDEHPFRFGVHEIRDEVLAPYPRTPAIVKQHLAEYYAMITHLDHEIGRVMQAVEDAGEWDNTLFVFAADNGLAVGQHGLFGKQNLYEHSVRVPLIFAGPGIPAGARRDTYAYLLDIYPTLCDLLGLQIPASVEGHSLLPAIKDASVTHRDALYFAYTDLIRGVKDERYKLIEYISEGVNTTQLFDLAEDPAELHNLADDPAHASRLVQLRERLHAFRDAWDDRKDPLGETFWSQYDRLK